MRIITLAVVVLLSSLYTTAGAQKYITKTGKIEIFSETPLFTIDGVNKKVASILNAENGEVVASTLVRSFRFEEALVEEHFNENYLEPNLYPKAIFKGRILNFDEINLSEDGTYEITISGELTIHGQTRPITEEGELVITAGNITATTRFEVSLEDYKVEIERAYKNAIKDEILLKIYFNYQPYKKT